MFYISPLCIRGAIFKSCLAVVSSSSSLYDDRIEYTRHNTHLFISFHTNQRTNEPTNQPVFLPSHKARVIKTWRKWMSACRIANDLYIYTCTDTDTKSKKRVCEKERERKRSYGKQAANMTVTWRSVK